MEHNYTEKNLIQLIYGECDILENDLCLRDNYDELYKAYKSLPKVKFSPLTSTIDNLINYGNGKLEPAIC
jgi:hypothetical protein